MDPRPPDDDASAAERERMVSTQLRSRGVADERVLAAIQAVPREAFVRPDLRRAAYADDALPIEAGQTISQPYIVALMTELLSVRPGDRVLEIGTGSGYQAAILAELGCQVVTIERLEELAETARERLERLGYGDRVEVRVGDGSVGDPDGAPWRGILVAAAAPRVPDALRRQLAADGGRLVLPVGEPGRQELVVVVRSGDRWTEERAGRVAFVPLIGKAGFARDER
ncbi:MAG TPA: protein-L-isoaspartate(D-aspartate) O-methyltransferase [Candidatus Limnocylindrales bacterium]|nr:protein-L-isoaspartate(D-aspartate) O-methyltransferase [Candidatus Limnocylindrales bacterium]